MHRFAPLQTRKFTEMVVKRLAIFHGIMPKACKMYQDRHFLTNTDRIFAEFFQCSIRDHEPQGEFIVFHEFRRIRVRRLAISFRVLPERDVCLVLEFEFEYSSSNVRVLDSAE